MAAVLEGIRVVDLTGEAGALAARVLADLGATVTRPEPLDGGHFSHQPHRHAAWTARTEIRRMAADDPELDALLAAADVVLATRGHGVEVDRAPTAVWVHLSPFGLTGPRAVWRAGDLGILASTGNLFATGDPDRPPVRCAEPVAFAHVGPEAAFAAVTGLLTGRPQQIDVSVQEAVMVASMGAAGRFARDPDRGRRVAERGPMREIWPCADGWVRFALRGGESQAPSLAALGAEVGDPALTEQDWTTFRPDAGSTDGLAGLEEALGAWFVTRTKAELHALAQATGLPLAPVNAAADLLASEQLQARGLFGPLAGVAAAPLGFVHVHDGPAPDGPRAAPDTATTHQTFGGSVGAWTGTRILELDRGAAGAIATRYFAEHGADVIRIESRRHPDDLRGGTGWDPDGLERSALFDALNPDKRSVAINLDHPDARALVIELVKAADAVAVDLTPQALSGYGLAYADLLEHKADLVMIATSVEGQTGPHRDRPATAGLGGALAGFDHLTGWPDRDPTAPFGTITESLAPRFSAAALAAALLRRRRTGQGTYLDLSQVEAGVYALSPWLVEHQLTGVARGRRGNRAGRYAPHGVFPCAGEDRWIALAVYTEPEWAQLAAEAGLARPEWASVHGRLADVDALEVAVGAWTAGRDAQDLAERLQGLGIEAVPVADFGDASADPQLRARGHYVALDHPVLGPGEYERNGIRVSGAPCGYLAPSPTLGQHTEEVLADVLGLDPPEITRLRDAGVIS